MDGRPEAGSDVDDPPQQGERDAPGLTVVGVDAGGLTVNADDGCELGLQQTVFADDLVAAAEDVAFRP